MKKEKQDRKNLIMYQIRVAHKGDMLVPVGATVGDAISELEKKGFDVSGMKIDLVTCPGQESSQPSDVMERVLRYGDILEIAESHTDMSNTDAEVERLQQEALADARNQKCHNGNGCGVWCCGQDGCKCGAGEEDEDEDEDEDEEYDDEEVSDVVRPGNLKTVLAAYAALHEMTSVTASIRRRPDGTFAFSLSGSDNSNM